MIPAAVLSVFITLVMCEYDKRILTTLKYSRHRVIPTVVNGLPAYIGQFPTFVSIKVPVNRLGNHRTVWENTCGGAIIGKESVLSAAHCFEFNHFYYAKNPDILRAVAGNTRNSVTHSGDTETNDQYQWRTIEKVVLHEDFSFPANDIAVLFVDTPWNFTKNVQYAVLASRTTDYSQSCFVAGFGRIYGLRGRTSPVLLYAAISLLPRHMCNVLWELDMSSYICTDTSVSDLGEGDSGGPLICAADASGRDLIVGVASAKNADRTTLFTRVSQYTRWIKSRDRQSATNDACRVFLYLFVIIFLIVIYNLF